MSAQFHMRTAPGRVVASVAVALSCALVVAPLQGAAAAPVTESPSARPGTPNDGAYVGSAPQRWKLTESVTEALGAYEAAREKVAALSAQSARLNDAAERMDDTASKLRDEVAGSDGGGLLDVVAGLVSDGESALDLAEAAAEDAEHAIAIAAAAEQGLKEAIAETERARRAWERARAEVATLEAAWTAREAARAALALAVLRPEYAVTDPAQDRRNRASLDRWRSYLRSLGQRGVLPPDASRLEDPDRLPRGLEMVRDATGRAVPGVAASDSHRVLNVLPAETIRAVSAAFNRLGLAEVPGAVESSAYACGGLVANAWSATATLPGDSVNQWRELRSVRMSSLQVGDVVVLGSAKAGLEQSGVYVGNRNVILADPITGTAAVQPLVRDAVYGVKRIGLKPSRTLEGPAAGACGFEASLEDPEEPLVGPTPGTGQGPLTVPVPAGSYQLSALFGDSGSMWSSGVHSGLDFAAPTGTPVTAIAGGTVTIEASSWAGELVRIDHGGGVESWYAHLSEVDVESGDVVTTRGAVGAVGSEGNSTGPHLHLEVRLDGTPVDPALVLDVPELPRPTYANGEIPSAAMCAATPDGGQLLRCDAAVGYRMMSAAYEEQIGEPLCLTDSYRSYAGQEEVFRTKPGFAAVPGTSVHGEGLAVDLCGGVESFSTSEHLWLASEGTAFGWRHPSWAAEGGSRPEPWHFEYS